MNIKDFQIFADTSWKKYICTVSKLSETKQNNLPLVSSDYEYYNFDEITDDLYPPKKKVASVDGLEITNKSINLVEFKSGFKKIITKDNYDESKAFCPQNTTGDPIYCNSIKDSYLKSESLFLEKLIDNIKLKAVESINTLEYKIYPNINNSDNQKIKRNLIVVLDVSPLNTYEDILDDLSNKKSNSNAFSKVRESLLRFINLKGKIEFYYDNVTVLSSDQYKEQLELKY